MPLFQGSSNLNMENGIFIDESTNILCEGHQARSGQGLDMLREACIPQALYDSSERNTPGCFPGTREEHIYNITNWGLGEWKARQARALWLQGPAGVGKSALAQSCAEGMRGRLGAAFFFSRQNGWNDPNKFLPTFVYQLTTKHPPYRDRVDAIVLGDPLVLEKSIGVQFYELLVLPLKELKGVGRGVDEDVVILIDGLDECYGTDAQTTIIQIIIASVHQQSTPFVWAFFSRPEPHIRAAFSTKQATDVCLHLTLPVSRDADRDIEAYLRDGFKMIRAKYNLPTAFTWPSEDDIHQLVERSAGLFIYTASAIRYVASPGARGPEERLRSLLELDSTETSDNPLANLDRFYILIMKQIPKETLPTTLLFLSAITSRYIPSHIPLICAILGFSLTTFYAAVSNLYSVLKIDNSEDGMPDLLALYHASFSDFLQDKKRSTQQFFMGGDDVYDRLESLYVDALFRASNTASGVNTLSWPSPDLNFICASAFHHLLFSSKEKNGHLRVDLLDQLSRVNWSVVGQSYAELTELVWVVEALIRKIPENWRPKIIRSCNPKSSTPIQRLWKPFNRLMPVPSATRYVMGHGNDQVFLV
ncbi:hypothetical protein P691DRAFT_710823 [Macrolepiota fuliginosa MF-IS2]|uniref:Nephrocystin 3-like N-terminal domain-containing protein n=1 Tax=Macrolepiota fuliginosa MF-IS2 TaxID=1400762 RepID=A0A9P6BZ91_9AGAR|nr:hypothetical protein P691DRAFT_710823 [Macrolepiota fuliginosa MF-IS2]